MVRVLLADAAYEHISHLYGLSPVCVLMCIFSRLPCFVENEQISHLNGIVSRSGCLIGIRLGSGSGSDFRSICGISVVTVCAVTVCAVTVCAFALSCLNRGGAEIFDGLQNM